MDRLPRYRVADLLIDVGRRSVQRSTDEIHLPRLSFEVLRVLIEAAPDVVSNHELARAVWKGVVVGPETVTQRVKLLRDALGDDPAAPRYVVGLRGQGYRLFAPVVVESDTGTATGLDPPTAAKRRTPSRLLGIVLGVAALVGVMVYRGVDRLLVSRPAGSTPVVAAKGDTSQAGAAADLPESNAEPAFAPPPQSIAVLPFLNMSGDAKQDYFSDGLTEELINSLSRVNELQVAARTSSFSFKGKDTDLATIARKLNVGSVLEGSVRRSGHTVRVTAQLNNAVTGFHLWSQTYDRDDGDVLSLQTEIANAVANSLRLTLVRDVAATIELGGTRSPAAFDAYLRGVEASTSNTEAEQRTAIAAYTDAIRLDPRYALAFAARSKAHSDYTRLATGAAVRENFNMAQVDARRAIRLAPALAEGHIAFAEFLDGGSLDFIHARAEYEQALALAPGNAEVLRESSQFLVDMGQFDKGVSVARRAVVLDPLDRRSHYRLGTVLYFSRRYREAVAAFTDAIKLDPHYRDALAVRGLAYYGLGELEKARASCESAPDFWLNQLCLAVVYAKLGRRAEAQALFARMQAAWGDSVACQYALIWAQWGEQGRALEWLETALRSRDSGLEELKADPLLDPLRAEPRFQAIQRELKFPD